MRLSQLISSLPSIQPQPDSDPDIALITDDSRRVEPGALFVAYPGVSVDGHRFIPDAIERGAVAIVGEQEWSAAGDRWPAIRKVHYLRVRSGREAFAYLHAAWNDFPARRLIMIGVTGTDGKTTTTNLIHSILTAAGIKAGMISTVNAIIGDEVLDTGLHVTTPDADQLQAYLRRMVDARLTHCVLEVTSHGLQQHRVSGCDFDVAVVTNITHEHLDLHGSLEAYRAAKAALFESLATAYPKDVPKSAVLNLDDSSYDYLRERIQAPCFSYAVARHAGAEDAETQPGPAALSASLRRMTPDVRATDIVYAPDALRFNAVGERVKIPIETTFVGEFNVSNCLAAIAATVNALGIDPDAARRGIAALKGVPGRMERIDEGQAFIAIVDFAHTPNALEKAIAAARTMTKSRVIVVFGSAGLRDREKRRMMGTVAARFADQIVITAEDPRTESLAAIMAVTARAIQTQGRFEGVDFWRVADRGAAIAFACSLARPGDVVLACGKGHEQSMCFGAIEYPWDDRDAMRAALRGKPLRTLPTAE